jgi:hypothetical protein
MRRLPLVLRRVKQFHYREWWPAVVSALAVPLLAMRQVSPHSCRQQHSALVLWEFHRSRASQRLPLQSWLAQEPSSRSQLP